MVKSAKATGFALVHHSQQVNVWHGRCKPQAFLSLTNCVHHEGFKHCKREAGINPTLRGAFLSVLSTSPSRNGMANELRSCKDREEKGMYFMNAFFLPSENPMAEAHRSIFRVPTASPTAIAGKQYHRLCWFSWAWKKCQMEVTSEQGALSSTCTPSPSKTTSTEKVKSPVLNFQRGILKSHRKIVRKL